MRIAIQRAIRFLIGPNAMLRTLIRKCDTLTFRGLSFSSSFHLFRFRFSSFSIDLFPLIHYTSGKLFGRAETCSSIDTIWRYTRNGKKRKRYLKTYNAVADLIPSIAAHKTSYRYSFLMWLRMQEDGKDGKKRRSKFKKKKKSNDSNQQQHFVHSKKLNEGRKKGT